MWTQNICVCVCMPTTEKAPQTLANSDGMIHIQRNETVLGSVAGRGYARQLPTFCFCMHSEKE